jgi:predicted permease
VLGLLFSQWAADVLVRLLSTSYELVVVDVAPGRRLFGFIALVVGISTALVTIAPIVRASRIEPARGFDTSARDTGSLHRARTAQVLVAMQVAISLTLLAGSALFVRDLRHLLATDVGFERENLLVVGVDALSPLSAPQRRAAAAPGLMSYYAELLRRLGDTPGVRSVSLSRKAPISNEQGSWWTSVAADGAAAPANSGDRTYLNAISPGYFTTIGMPIVAGRDFTWSDREGAPPVVIVNAALARAHFGSESPIRRHLLMGQSATRLEVVGLVRDTTYQNMREDRRRIAYLPYMQRPELLRADNLVAEVRVTGTGRAMAEPIRAAVRSVDPSVPLTIQSVGSRIDESLVAERLITLIAVFLGATSLLLACGALGGLTAHVVTARTREIGLRLALGAERRWVLHLVMRQALTVSALGALAGVGLTLAGGRMISRFLSRIGPADPWALAAAAAILLLTTAVAGYVPARRAARVDPMDALRSE